MSPLHRSVQISGGNQVAYQADFLSKIVATVVAFKSLEINVKERKVSKKIHFISMEFSKITDMMVPCQCSK